MTAAGPRVTPGTLRDIGPVNWLFIRAAGRVSRTNPPYLFATMARRRALFRGWLRFAGRLMPGGSLPRRDTELVILRVAALNSCEYELTHHRRLGRRAGLTDSQIERAADAAEPDAQDGWSDRERALLDAVHDLQTDGDVTDAHWSSLRAHLDEGEAVELVLLAGHYRMLASFITTLRIPTDTHR